jgi:hypothetical protein
LSPSSLTETFDSPGYKSKRKLEIDQEQTDRVAFTSPAITILHPNPQRDDIPPWFLKGDLPQSHNGGPLVSLFFPQRSPTRPTMGLSLEQSPFLQALSGNGPQRTRSSITELLKLFGQSPKDGPRYLNQLEEIVRFASGGSTSGTPLISINLSLRN